ncbi:MAG TPA: hypothetical protein VJ276_12110 [Thermoanaerobaculia bacterium]|nr:hypothetical protein [Thermoanaerobaculia bacterium]
MKAKKKKEQELEAEPPVPPDWKPLPGVPSKKYPGLVYLYPTEPSIIGLEKIEAAVDAVIARRHQREAAERAQKKKQRR